MTGVSSAKKLFPTLTEILSLPVNLCFEGTRISPDVHQLVALAGKHADSEICDHLHAYTDSRRLMQWYDAFDLPLLVDESIAEASIQSFCSKLGVRYARWHAAQ